MDFVLVIWSFLVLDLHEFWQYKIDDMAGGKPKIDQINRGKSKFVQITGGKPKFSQIIGGVIFHEGPKPNKF